MSGIHDTDLVRHPRDHAKVVRDQQHAHPAVPLQGRKQIEHLGLDRDVQGRRRFVGYQQFGVSGQRHGYHHALFHAARELERIVVEPAQRVGNAYRREQFARALTRLRAAQPTMQGQCFADLIGHGYDRIEAGGRLLEHHGNPATAHGAHLALGQRAQILAFEYHLAIGQHAAVGQQAHDRQRGHGFAATRFAEQRKGLSAFNTQRHAIDRLHGAARGRQAYAKIGDIEQSLVLRRVARHAPPSGSGDFGSISAFAGRAPRARHRRTDWPTAPART